MAKTRQEDRKPGVWKGRKETERVRKGERESVCVCVRKGKQARRSLFITHQT